MFRTFLSESEKRREYDITKETRADEVITLNLIILLTPKMLIFILHRVCGRSLKKGQIGSMRDVRSSGSMLSAIFTHSS